MAIANFPASLQPIIQQNFLEREFKNGLESALGFDAIADREDFPARIGQTITSTRKGLKAPVTTPMNPDSNTNFDNGLTPSGWSVEQYTLTINQYGDTIDLNIVNEGVGIADQFLANAYTNGVQARQSLDRIARNALFGGAMNGVGGYLGGNTRITATSTSASVKVDDIRGFQTVQIEGQVVAIGASDGLAAIIGTGDYTVIGATADAVNVSTAPNGISGTLTLNGNVSTADGTAGTAVVATTAPKVVRPNARLTSAALVAPTGTYGGTTYVPGDTLTMDCINQSTAYLRSNNVPTIDGFYHCYADPATIMGLFRDADFKYLYRGAYGSDTYRDGQVIEILGVRIIPTTEAPQQASLGAGAIHRAIVVGKGALVRGDYQLTGRKLVPDDGLLTMLDGVCMATREPLDRLKQIIAQSWYWIGGFALPTDSTADPTIIPTASNSYLKRGVVIECLGLG